MAFFSDTATAQDQPGFFASLSANLGAFFVRLMEAQSRSETVNRLRALSDRELADMGISRDDIVRHVYGDIYYL